MIEKKPDINANKINFRYPKNLKKKGIKSSGNNFIPIAIAINKPPKNGFFLKQNIHENIVKHNIKLSLCKFPNPSIITIGFKKYHTMYFGSSFRYSNKNFVPKNKQISPIK
tara:strand:+ start:4165 stop:4497 length:333 start_codon:yes stop_codon:yes gene_type:complete